MSAGTIVEDTSYFLRINFQIQAHREIINGGTDAFALHTSDMDSTDHSPRVKCIVGKSAVLVER